MPRETCDIRTPQTRTFRRGADFLSQLGSYCPIEPMAPDLPNSPSVDEAFASFVLTGRPGDLAIVFDEAAPVPAAPVCSSVTPATPG